MYRQAADLVLFESRKKLEVRRHSRAPLGTDRVEQPSGSSSNSVVSCQGPDWKGEGRRIPVLLVSETGGTQQREQGPGPGSLLLPMF